MIRDKSQFHFRGQMEGEVVKDFYRKHWICLMPQFFSFIFFITFVIILAANLRYLQLPPFSTPLFETLVILAMIGTGIIIHKFFMNILEYFMNVVIITNNRVVIVKKSLFIHDDKESIYMKEIQDLQKQQTGIIKNFLHYGELLVNVGVPELTILRLVPNPDYHFRLMNMIRHDVYDKPEEDRTHRDLGLDDIESLREDVSLAENSEIK